MSEAERLFALTFWRTLRAFGRIASLRQVAGIGLDQAVPKIVAGAVRDLKELDSEGVFDSLLETPPGDGRSGRDIIMDLTGGIEAMAWKTAGGTLAAYRTAVDAASLLFAHAALDSAAADYCRVCGLVCPDAWEFAVQRQQVRLSDLKGRSYDDLLRDKVAAHITALERESLPKKVDVLHMVCKPPKGFGLSNGYRFDRGRVEQLDGLRHAAAHGRRIDTPLPQGDADVFYLQQTAAYLMVLVHNQFGIMLRPELFVEAMQEDGGSPDLSSAPS